MLGHLGQKINNNKIKGLKKKNTYLFKRTLNNNNNKTNKYINENNFKSYLDRYTFKIFILINF